MWDTGPGEGVQAGRSLFDTQEKRLSTVRYHILYWESADFAGIQFSNNGRRDGPARCHACASIVDAWRWRMDNMQGSLRVCAHPGTSTFRPEIVDFSCLSPGMCIEYNLRVFERYNNAVGSQILTEETVIGAAMDAHSHGVASETSGVTVRDFGTFHGTNNAVHVGWLQDYVGAIRRSAEDVGGSAALLMLDKHGIDVGSFGVSTPMFAHAPANPIREVVVLLGGPKGIEDAPLATILQVCNDAIHLTLRVRLPGGRQHSYVALGDLLGYHDRGFLIPILEDARHLGTDKYTEWFRKVSTTLDRFANSGHSLSDKKGMLRGFVKGIREELAGMKQAEVGLPDPIDELRTTPLDVERRLAVVEAVGLLPPITWRVRQGVLAIEPHRALALVYRVEREASLALSMGAPLPDPWGLLSELLEESVTQTPPAEHATVVAVAEALTSTRAVWERGRVGIAAPEFWEDLRAVRNLPCVEAVKLLGELKDRGARPAHGLTTEAEIRASWLEGDSANALREASNLQTSRMVRTSARPKPKQPSMPPPQSVLPERSEEWPRPESCHGWHTLKRQKTA